MSNGMFTCTLRKISTGYKVAAFCGDSLDDLRNIATTLMRASEWSRCYVVCVDWQGNTMFSLNPEGRSAPEPGAGLPMPQAQAPRLPMNGAQAHRPAPSWEGYEGHMAALRASTAREGAYRAPQLPAVPDAEFEETPKALPPFRGQ